MNEAARDLARAVGVLFRLILEGIVAYVLAKGAAQATARVAQLVERLKASRLGAGFARWVEVNWQRLVDDPRLNRNARSGGRAGDDAPDAAPPPSSASPKPPKSNVPPVQARAPANRHYINKVKQNTVAKNKNTMIEPGVDVRGDVAGINAGQAVRNGDMYTINGRTYGLEPNGTLYPVSGPGFHPLDRIDLLQKSS